MPSRVRYQAKRGWKLADQVLKNPPPHIAKRLLSPSPLLAKLHSELPVRQDWRAVRFIGEGTLWEPVNWGHAGGRATKRAANERAERLRKKYRPWWGQRSRIEEIALREGLSTKTVERYFRDTPF